MGGLGGGEGGPYVELVVPTVGQVVALVTTPAALTTTTRLYVRHASRPLGTTAVGSSIQACCAACWADVQCTAAAYTPSAPNTCWLKYGGTLVPKSGVTTCTIDL